MSPPSIGAAMPSHMSQNRLNHFLFFSSACLSFIFSKFLLLFQIFYLFFTFSFSSSVVSIFFILTTISCLINCTLRRTIPLKCKYNKNRTNIRI